jgi:hypothetical protein
MFTIEIDPASKRALLELRRRNREALRVITPGESGLDDLIADATLQLRDAAERNAPRLTGALARAHRGQFADLVGRVFIDPSAQNPVSGGFPAEYGPVVHGRKPWMAEAVARDAPRILIATGERLFERFDGVYRQ